MPTEETTTKADTADTADKRPRLHILEHVDSGHDRDATKAGIGVKTDRGDVMLVLSPDALSRHIAVCQHVLTLLMERGVKPEPPFDADAAEPARQVEFLRHTRSGDPILRITLASGRVVPVRIDTRMAAEVKSSILRTW